jgi:hypothetical protein
MPAHEAGEFEAVDVFLRVQHEGREEGGEGERQQQGSRSKS